VRLGATLTFLPAGAPIAVADWARRLAGAGFDSLWTPEIIGRGGLVPDPFVALAAAATATEHIEVGTATVQVPLHHPAELAHRIHSLMAVCGGRLTLGLSPGSTATDYRTLDRDHATRFRVFRENVARLRVLVADGRDDRADIAPVRSGSKPPQLLLGSWGANVDRAAREFDGWLASGYRRSADQIIAALRRFRAAGGGRAIVCAVPVGADLGPAAEALQRYAAAGFDDAVVMFPPDGPDPDAVRALLP
jgi:alkanesulfonate monooxygenase SsuD/methylene tetrahydromethanopterin reductase-like flavin-dependent oxidoreductase (luciferase family)